MRTLLLMRHAKSSWRKPDLPDHDRPLNGRGKRAAPFMASVLHEQGLTPDFIVGSTAIRAAETARLLVAGLGYDGPLELTRRLYLAEPSAYFDKLTEVPHGVQTCLLVGHNPGLEEFIYQLTGREEEMPTAAIVRVDVDVEEIADISPATSGQRVGFWRPPKEKKK